MSSQGTIGHGRGSAVGALARRWAAHVPLSRLLWGLMLCVHVPPLLKAWRQVVQSHPSEAPWVGCAWLTVAVAFFVLKVLGVRWLRFQTDRWSLCAVALAVLLMHGGIVGVNAHGVAVPGDMALLTTALVTVGLRPVQSLLSDLVAAKQRRRSVCPLAVLGPMCSAAPVRTGRQLLPSCAPRSPPQVC